MTAPLTALIVLAMLAGCGHGEGIDGDCKARPWLQKCFNCYNGRCGG